jgi:hypothetical protein
MALRAVLTTGVVYLRKLYAGAGGESYTPSGVIHTDVTQAATAANQTLTTLATFTLPANSLAANGQVLRITAWGQNGANGNTKNYFLGLGGDTIVSRATTGNAVGWMMQAIIVRTASDTYDATGWSSVGGSMANNVPAAGSEDFTGALTITLKAQNGTASAGDCVFDGLMIEILP